jgi:hypothetical protein
MLKSKLFISFIVVECCLLVVCWLHGGTTLLSDRTAQLQAQKQLVHHLGLTDLAIWTEARYTRHPSQTDFFTAFQDFPGSLDHFPAGSIMAPSQVSSGETP